MHLNCLPPSIWAKGGPASTGRSLVGDAGSVDRQLQFGVMTANRRKVEGVMRPSNSNREAEERGVPASVVLKRSL